MPSTCQHQRSAERKHDAAETKRRQQAQRARRRAVQSSVERKREAQRKRNASRSHNRDAARTCKYASLFPSDEDANSVALQSGAKTESGRHLRILAAEELEDSHVWPLWLEPWDGERAEWMTSLTYWFRRAGHRFTITTVGQFRVKLNYHGSQAFYRVGTMQLDGKEIPFWVKYSDYMGAEIGIKGFGVSTSPDTASFLELPGEQPITKEEFPLAWQLLGTGETDFSDADHRVLFQNPETESWLAYPEFYAAKQARLKVLDADRRREGVPEGMPRFLHDVNQLVSEYTVSIMSGSFEEMKGLLDLQDDHLILDAGWREPKAMLCDGYLLGRGFCGTGDLDVEDVVRLFQDGGVSFLGGCEWVRTENGLRVF